MELTLKCRKKVAPNVYEHTAFVLNIPDSLLRWGKDSEWEIEGMEIDKANNWERIRSGKKPCGCLEPMDMDVSI